MTSTVAKYNLAQSCYQGGLVSQPPSIMALRIKIPVKTVNNS